MEPINHPESWVNYSFIFSFRYGWFWKGFQQTHISSSNRMFHRLEQEKIYALFFAVDTYNDPGWDDLKNPVRDVCAIATELTTNFGFETTIHENPTKDEITESIQDWKTRQFEPDAQLFIFVSGHGTVSGFDGEGYFIPSDADRKDKNQLSLLSLRQAVTQINCSHIALIVDACYSGTILNYKGEKPTPIRKEETDSIKISRIIAKELNKPSRFILTSGGRERTEDGDVHSPLVWGILHALEQEESLLFWDRFVVEVRESYRKKSKIAKPRSGTFSGHREGGFLFFRENSVDIEMDNHFHVCSQDSDGLPEEIKIIAYDLPSYPFVFIKGGICQMDKDSLLSVNDFMIGQTEVTQELWVRVMGDNPSYFKEDNRPVENVSWKDCQEFIRQLNQQTGLTFRLPTEVEWEYAARGENPDQIPLPGFLALYGNYLEQRNEDEYPFTAPVKKFRSNDRNLYDMYGNVWEWCQNESSAKADSKQMILGGSWFQTQSSFLETQREKTPSHIRSRTIGFRLVLDP